MDVRTLLRLSSRHRPAHALNPPRGQSTPARAVAPTATVAAGAECTGAPANPGCRERLHLLAFPAVAGKTSDARRLATAPARPGHRLRRNQPGLLQPRGGVRGVQYG